jgi:hypothetical protein
MTWPMVYFVVLICFIVAVILIVFWLRQPASPRGFDVEPKRDEVKPTPPADRE